MRKCPKCGSEEVKEDELGNLVCSDCGYDESIAGGERSSQKAKGEHSPYQAGGGKRTR